MPLQNDAPSTKVMILNAMRWILVLPAAVAGGTIIAYVAVRCIGFFEDFGHPRMDGWGFGRHWLLGPLYTVAQAAISASGFVLVGTYTAPQKRSVVSIILGTIWGLFLVALYGLFWVAFYNDAPEARTWSAGIRTTLYFGVGMFANVLTAFSINEREELLT